MKATTNDTIAADLRESLAWRHLRSVLLPLLQFQYKHHGYGQMTCSSCGAVGSEDEGKVRTEPCSRSCPWRIARETVSE